MKINKIMAGLMIVSSVFSAEAKPGDIYILTGQEKSIEEIVKADMGKYPDLYKGESYNFYVGKFKQENKIGKRKLAPGEGLFFPETKASIKAKAEARRLLLIGKWVYKQSRKSASEQIKSIESTTICEFKDDGEYTCELASTLVLETPQETVSEFTNTKYGRWIVDDNLIKIKDVKSMSNKKITQGTKRWVEHTIILLTEDELHTQVENRKIIKYTRLK